MKQQPTNYAFPPKVINSGRKNYRCFTCWKTINAGKMYVAYPVKDGKTVKTLHVCLLCSMLLKDSRDCTIKPGGFSERLIPNCLRKKKAEFLRKFQKDSRIAVLEQIAK